MFSFFKKKDQKKQVIQHIDPMYNFSWFEVGNGNPFNKRILDIRPFTQKMISTTKDPTIAQLFLTNRQSSGEGYIGFNFKNSTSVDTQLIYAHKTGRIEGVGYRAKVMEDKWDIYVWNDIIYFVRSWTSEVGYKAYISYSDNTLEVHKIEIDGNNRSESEQSIAINNVHFLISTLAFKAVQPHKIPSHLTTNEEIAAYSFSIFGRNCWYATYEDVINLTINESN